MTRLLRAVRRCMLAGVMAILCLARFGRLAGAEHFYIQLRVGNGTDRVESSMDTTPPIGGVNPRPVLKVKSGQPLSVTWTMKSGFPHGVMKNVTIHFFVVREEKVGQKPVPNPAGPAGIVDNSFVMDFQPTSSSNGALRLKAPEPGNYLVRVQSENTHIEHDHEHFSAIDLVVE